MKEILLGAGGIRKTVDGASNTISGSLNCQGLWRLSMGVITAQRSGRQDLEAVPLPLLSSSSAWGTRTREGLRPSTSYTLELRQRRTALAAIWDPVSGMSAFLSGCCSSDLCVECWPCHAKMQPSLSKGIQIISFFLILPTLHCGIMLWNKHRSTLKQDPRAHSWKAQDLPLSEVLP